MLGRSLATVGLVFALSACGGRTGLRLPDYGSPEDSSQAGAAGPFAGMGGSSSGDGGSAGAGHAGQGDSGAGGHAADNSAGDGSAGMTGGSSGSGATGTGGTAGFSAGQGASGASGVSGRPEPAGEGGGGVAGMAGDILNPQDCATPNPFVLSIDPMGTSGSVRGWLESTAGLVFEDQLPRFVRAFDEDMLVSDRSIVLWWSIASVDSDGQDQLYFYGSDYTISATEIAVARGATRFADIDIDALDFGLQTVEAQTGSLIVFRNTVTGEALALRVDQIFVTDAAGDVLCAAVDASWRFLRPPG